MSHPDFAVLTVSWELALRADGYADNAVKAYRKAVQRLADWLADHQTEVGPAELERQHIRPGRHRRDQSDTGRSRWVKAARALDRYIRERRRHQYADTPRLWLGSRGRPT